MIVLTKATLITFNTLVNSLSRGQERLDIEIVGDEIIFRARSCRTELSIKQAKYCPQRIDNCVLALIPDIHGMDIKSIVNLISTSI